MMIRLHIHLKTMSFVNSLVLFKIVMKSSVHETRQAFGKCQYTQACDTILAKECVMCDVRSGPLRSFKK